MDACVLTNKYPNENDYYKNAFVHNRVKMYIDKGLKIEVFVFSKSSSYVYVYDGVKVTVGGISNFIDFFKNKKPRKLLVHFIDRYMMNAINKLDKPIPTIVWIHGVEALGWYRRLFNIDRNFWKYIIVNSMQLWNLNKFLRKKNDLKMVFVSNWMKCIMEKDTFSAVKDYEIIPNVIDTETFSYKQKSPEDTKKILVIRPFTTKKYATDIVVKSILELSKNVLFDQYTITIYGDGPLFDEILHPLRKFKNVSLNRRFLSKKEIKEQHDKHGIFLCPTRQDSQGVSMCEAMSSGLVPITSNNTAIPEFVKHNKTGILTNNTSKIIAREIMSLNADTDRFLEMSKRASESIRDLCSPEKVINSEVNIINK